MDHLLAFILAAALITITPRLDTMLVLWAATTVGPGHAGFSDTAKPPAEHSERRRRSVD